MELWIRSQDRDMLMEIFEVRLNWRNDKEIICNSYTTDCCDYDYRCLGTYASKERALEVLDEIQKTMMSRKGILTTLNEKEEFIPFENQLVIYEMPKE